MLLRHLKRHWFGRHRRAAVMCAHALSVVTFSTCAEAIEFSIRQIADESRNNREPAIGETGLAAWYSHGTNSDEVRFSDITALVDGKLKVITEGSYGNYFGSIKPVVQGNAIIW